MIYTITAKSDQFICLINKPYAWQVLVPSTAGLTRNDKIRYNEVDDNNDLTGRYVVGLVKFVGKGDVIITNNSSVFAYVDTILFNESNI